MGNESAEATCAVCGGSCEGIPYATGIDGKLICRPCLDRQRHTWALRRPQEAKLVANLLQEQMEGAWQCPNCNHFVPQDSLICLECGFNRKKGRTHATRVRAPGERKRGRKP